VPATGKNIRTNYDVTSKFISKIFIKMLTVYDIHYVDERLSNIYNLLILLCEGPLCVWAQEWTPQALP